MFGPKLLLPLAGLIGSVLIVVLGLAFSGTVLSFAASSGADTNIGSFSGVQNLNDLQPLIYYMVLTISALASLGGGVLAARAAAKKGR